MIKVLIKGEHTNHYHNGYYRIDPLTSSVTLIREGENNILVDTGAFVYGEKLKEELAEEELKPEDINYIFNTHYHLDHTTNNYLFPIAVVFVGNGVLDLKTGICDIFDDKSLRKLPDGVEVLETPGHTSSHFSVVYKDGGQTYVVAGDAVREDILRDPEIPSASQKNPEFWKSVKKIFEVADVIIPGHGDVIEGEKFEELRKLL